MAAIDLGALPPTLVVPGLAAWLGRDPHASEADFQASLDGGFTESFEDFCTRISKEAA